MTNDLKADAHAGDTKALAQLMNASFQPKGISVKLAKSGPVLKVLMESDRLPDRKLAGAVRKGIDGIKPAGIEKVFLKAQSSGGKDNWIEQWALSNQQPMENDQRNSKIEQVVTETIQPEKCSVSNKSIPHQEAPIFIECNGEGGSLVLTEKEIIFKRKGGILSPHKKGDKHIPYDKIINFQYASSTLLSPGYIYFQLADQPLSINYMTACGHENAITFIWQVAESFERAKAYLDRRFNPDSYDKTFEGRSGTLILTDRGVILKRVGGFLSSHTAGEKQIPYRNITAVQFKPADLTVGFIQFTLQGGRESLGGTFDAVSDENTITFGTEAKTQEFLIAKEIIEQRIDEAQNPKKHQSGNSEIDQLEKLASLRDRGILSEEEFQLKKKQILGI